MGIAIKIALSINFIEILLAFDKHWPSSRVGELSDAWDVSCNLVVDESGVTVIEYAFIGSLITVAIAAVVGTAGTNLTSVFMTVASNM